MAYWCDDRRLDIEQRRLDAEQKRAKERIDGYHECCGFAATGPHAETCFAAAIRKALEEKHHA